MSDATDTRSINAEMELPRVGGLGALVLYLFPGTFLGVAVWHLFHATSTPAITVVASGLALAFVTLLTASACREVGGIEQFLVNRLGEFGWERFISIERHPDEQPLLCFGYRICGRNFYSLMVRIDDVISVRWGSGQATALAGRDMDDWSACLWYETDRITMISKLSLREYDRLEDVSCFGPRGPKEKIDEFGMSVVKFLFDSGVVLTATENECEFVNRNRLRKSDPPTIL